MGDANGFLALLDEYTKAKDVTRRRLYLEAMGQVIPNLGAKYILDPEQRSLLPLLDLGKKKGSNSMGNLLVLSGCSCFCFWLSAAFLHG